MEYLNKIELKGIVGRATNRFCTPTTSATSFSIVTEYCYKDMTGQDTIETMWMECYACDNKTAQTLQGGDRVHVIGRLHPQRYTDDSGEERATYKVIASSVEKIEEE